MAIPYTAKQLYDGFYSIEEGGVRSFLIIGKEKAMLVDTGFGTGDLKAFVQELTDKPVFLVNTHADGDHLGCNAQFDDIFMHPAEFDYYAAKGRACGELHALWEGDTIDLGTYRFAVIHIPGHTPGSIALLEPDKRLLIGGDSVQTGHIYMFGPGRNLPAYIHSMEKLLRMADQFDAVLPSHGELPVSPSILPALIQGAYDVLNGKIAPQPPIREGMPCKCYDFGTAKFLF